MEMHDMWLENMRLQLENAALWHLNGISCGVSAPRSGANALSWHADVPKMYAKIADDSVSTVSTTADIDNEESVEKEEPALLSTSRPMKERLVEGAARGIRTGIMNNGNLMVRWIVDAKRLSTKDQQIVSPSFELSEGVAFRLMIKPKAKGDKKGQAGFSKACGKGSIEVKVVEGVSLAPNLGFRICVDNDVQAGVPRGPVFHDFGKDTACGLPKNEDEWNFRSCVDPSSQTFAVSLEVLQTPHHGH
jgi:hypothetical protein